MGEPWVVGLADLVLDDSDYRVGAAKESCATVELEDAGCTVVVVLCTGVFRGLRSRRAWLIEPDRILPGLIRSRVP